MALIRAKRFARTPPNVSERQPRYRHGALRIAETGDLTAAFAASFLWGTGDRYRPHRYREIVDSTHGSLHDMLTAAAAAAAQDVIAGVAALALSGQGEELCAFDVAESETSSQG
jgi:hypothetical protein